MKLCEVQIELAGICNATCSYCDWQDRASGKQLMETNLAAKIIKECAELGVELVTFHGVGESTLHPQLVNFLRYGAELGLNLRLSTNCYALDRITGIDQVQPLEMILAMHRGLPQTFQNRARRNAIGYLRRQPKNRGVCVMFVCAAPITLEELQPYLEAVEPLPNAEIYLKQPVTWPRSELVRGYSPLFTHPRVRVDYSHTPRSLGRGCTMPERLLQVMADGTVAPCCVGTESWGLPHASVGLRQVWESERMLELRGLWQRADDSILCGHCQKRTDC